MMASEGIGLYTQAHEAVQINAPANIRVEDYAELVKRIAQHMVAKMPASVQVDDLIQSGMIGLLEAAKKFDGSRGASFETYAGIRIRGAIVDEIRKGDWVPRSVHRNSRLISNTIRQLEARLGRDAKDSEVAETMGISLDEYYAMSRDASASRLFSIDDTFESDESVVSDDKKSPFVDPHDGAQQQALTASLATAIDNLPEREKLVLSLYYDEELNLKEIGHILGVSESRVSQIHSQAALRLKSKLKDWQSA
jgi:RNA polymerase sigma factor for flagellar operon FliA